MNAEVKIIREVISRRISEKKGFNERRKETEARQGKFPLSRKRKSTEREEGFREALRLMDSEDVVRVPNWLVDDVEEYIEEQEKRNDSEWEEYQRLKEKFEE